MEILNSCFFEEGPFMHPVWLRHSEIFQITYTVTRFSDLYQIFSFYESYFMKEVNPIANTFSMKKMKNLQILYITPS